MIALQPEYKMRVIVVFQPRSSNFCNLSLLVPREELGAGSTMLRDTALGASRGRAEQCAPKNGAVMADDPRYRPESADRGQPYRLLSEIRDYGVEQGVQAVSQVLQADDDADSHDRCNEAVLDGGGSGRVVPEANEGGIHDSDLRFRRRTELQLPGAESSSFAAGWIWRRAD
jgi:hypothetical protein